MIENTPFNRRQALAGMAALGAAACGGDSLGQPAVTTPAPTPAPPPPPAPPAPVVSLAALAAAKGRRFGSAIGWRGSADGGSIQNPAYTDIIKAECNVIVAENEMKWQALRPDPNTFAFQRFDDIVDWGVANNKAIRGHTLLWHRPEWFPGWLNTYDFGANPVAEAERLLTTHINTVMNRYRGKIYSYDVVNEAIDNDEADGLMRTSLSNALGSPEAALDLAFHTARAADPTVQLVYNDYMSWEPPHTRHVANVLKLLEGFRARNVPVDALGIQSHIEMFTIDPTTGVGPYLETEWRKFLDEVVAMGYKLVITEFDVKDKALPSDIATRDARVADFTRRYFDVMMDYEELGDVVAWGMVDKFNWLQGFAPRDDGLEVRGCPYDSTYKAKPLRSALANALETAPVYSQ